MSDAVPYVAGLFCNRSLRTGPHFSLDDFLAGTWLVSVGGRRICRQGCALRRSRDTRKATENNVNRVAIVHRGGSRVPSKTRCRVAPTRGGLTMELQSPHVVAIPESTADLDRLGDEIAALATHLDAATA